MDESRNSARLCGRVCAAPLFSHQSKSESFYSFPLEVARLSGRADTVNIVARKTLLEKLEISESSKLCVIGELRSFNNKSGTGARLVITVFAKELFFCEEEDSNELHLIGTICKSPSLRTTPLGRDICDIMLAVNRRYGRSDYLPCIAWGIRAREASVFDVGTEIKVNGRLQSRNYIKLIDGEAIEKTAFEVSISEMSEIGQ